MKNLETKSIKQLLEIIPDHPGLRLSQFSDGGELFSDALSALCLEREYEYQLNILNEEFYPKAVERYGNNELSSVKKIKWEQRRYGSPAKQYDFLFITAEIPKEHRKFFAKTIHSHIKSAGHLILFLEKNNQKNIEEWYSFLEEYLFVAMNTIDLFENYEIFIAKKMHGWGGK
jgi:hypothetical protein